MTCSIVNSMLFCVEPISSRGKIFIPSDHAFAIESVTYRFVPDLKMETLAHAVTDKFITKTMQGCAIETGSKTAYYALPCDALDKSLR